MSRFLDDDLGEGLSDGAEGLDGIDEMDDIGDVDDEIDVSDITAIDIEHTEEDDIDADIDDILNDITQDTELLEMPQEDVDLTDEEMDSMIRELEQAKIREASDYSEEINCYIRSMEELEHYQGIGLEEAEIGGRMALISHEIDWDQLDENNETNAMRVARGRPPLDPQGYPYELHHIGQHVDSPLAELQWQQHRGKNVDRILHDKTIQSEAHADGTNWDKERMQYWQSRESQL